VSGASRARTGDLLGAIQALSQLSYSPGRRRRGPHGMRASVVGWSFHFSPRDWLEEPAAASRYENVGRHASFLLASRPANWR
jgi:hypothetical protein